MLPPILSSSRQKGAVDTVDLAIGVSVGLGLPLLAFLIMQMIYPDSPTVDGSRIQAPAPDIEEVTERLKFVKELYESNAAIYLARARNDGENQISYIRWAHVSLQRVKAEVTALEALIVSSNTASTFANQMGEVARYKQLVAEGDQVLRELDHNGNIIKREG